MPTAATELGRSKHSPGSHRQLRVFFIIILVYCPVGRGPMVDTTYYLLLYCMYVFVLLRQLFTMVQANARTLAPSYGGAVLLHRYAFLFCLYLVSLSSSGGVTSPKICSSLLVRAMYFSAALMPFPSPSSRPLRILQSDPVVPTLRLLFPS